MSKSSHESVDLEGLTSGGEEHKQNKQKKNENKHQHGITRKQCDYGGEKGDKKPRPPRRRPEGQTGPWPVKKKELQMKDRLKNNREGKKLYAKALQLTTKTGRRGTAAARKLLQESVRMGYVPAMYALASWYLHGTGVAKNYPKAVRLLKEAAKAKYAPAEYDLAVSFETGKGVSKSLRRAFKLYLSAAKHDDLDGATEVARCFYYGIGTTKDVKKALKWYRLAAEWDNSESQYAVGRAYEFGIGVRTNIAEALKWYRKASQSGHTAASKAVSDLQK